ncbi:uncharacterized protein TNCV_3026991 [Trichonephila clavipes]|nr:uncharacterized protein TNCV_3026991 [Trichonephila clavipes]
MCLETYRAACDSAFTIARLTGSRQRVMVWGAIFFEAGPLCSSLEAHLQHIERQMKLLDPGEDLWVPYLIGALPSDVTSLIAREPEEKCRDNSHIRGMLL